MANIRQWCYVGQLGQIGFRPTKEQENSYWKSTRVRRGTHLESVFLHIVPVPPFVPSYFGVPIKIFGGAAAVNHIIWKVADEVLNDSRGDYQYILTEVDPPSILPRGYGMERPLKPGIAVVV